MPDSSHEATSSPSPLLLTGRAMLLRCPRCGGRPLFGPWMRPARRCPGCGLQLERIDGHWIGALGVNTIITFSLLFVVILAAFLLAWPEAPGGWLVGIGLAVAVVFPIAFFPWSRTLWLAIDLWMRPSDD